MNTQYQNEIIADYGSDAETQVYEEEVADCWEDECYEEDIYNATATPPSAPIKPRSAFGPNITAFKKLELVTKTKTMQQKFDEEHAAIKKQAAEEKARKEAAELELTKTKLNWVSEPIESVDLKKSKDFPSLAAAAKSSPKKSGWKSAKSDTKVVMKKIEITMPSYSELKRVRETPNVAAVDRTAAFEKLADRETVVTALKFTKMCSSIASGSKCRHGDKCRFAHTLDQLTIRECFFGDGCRFVTNTEGVYSNKSRGRACDSKHPGETSTNFYSRTGLSKFVTPIAPPKEEPVEIKLPTMSRAKAERIVKEKAAERAISMSKPNAWANMAKKHESAPKVEKRTRKTRWDVEPAKEDSVSSTNTTPVRKTRWDVQPVKAAESAESAPKETVLRVPAALAMEAMKMAMASGLTNIRVEVV